MAKAKAVALPKPDIELTLTAAEAEFVITLVAYTESGAPDHATNIYQALRNAGVNLDRYLARVRVSSHDDELKDFDSIVLTGMESDDE